MYYVLVNYPQIPLEKIDAFRKKYDYSYPGIGAHITVMFPVPADGVVESEIKNHLTSILNRYKAFDIHLEGFEKAVDHWLFLGIKEGHDELIKLHDEIYTGPLSKYLRPDLPFIPHIALGFFGKEGSNYNLENPTIVEFDEDRYHKAIEEAKNLGLNFRTRFDKVSLITIEDDLKTISSQTEIKLL